MKKIVLMLSAILMLSGCYKDDIKDLKNDVNNLKERMAQYENLLDILNDRLYVVSYEIKEGSYIITMSDGSKLSVRNASSFIEIGENGNWWIDGADSGTKAVAENGKAPKITIGTNGNWFINDEDTGVSAAAQKGKDAAEIISVSITNGIISFTFADGRTISIPANAPEITLTTPNGGFTLDKMRWFKVKPEIKHPVGATFTWYVNNEEVASTSDLLYVFGVAGTYNIEFVAKNGVGEDSKTFTVTVNEKTYLNKITQVFDFLPAPGQFTNELPNGKITDTDETMRIKAETALTVTPKGMISLGGFGGYVVFGFDHTVINKEGNDFIVFGNAIDDWAEPGIIMVSYDANENGKPDDEWFEIAGSEHNKPTTIKNYEITYYKPETEPTNLNEPNYIRWTDNQGATGYIAKNQWHRQSFYPLWKGETLTYKGTFLKSNIYDKSGVGNNWANPAYEWGYADNWANGDVRGQIDISWAVNAKGESVKLKGIDFVRVYNSNHAAGGWLGEVSTEVTGFKDLNLP